MHDAPQADLLDLLAQLRAPLRNLFQKHGISPEEAEEILEEAMLLFLKRPQPVGAPRALFLSLVEDRIGRHQKRLRRRRLLLRLTR